VAGYGLFTPGAQSGQMSAVVATATASANLTLDRDTITTSDFYSLRVRLLANDRNTIMVQLIGRNPFGRMAVATVRGNKKTNSVEKDGMDNLDALLSGSADFAVLRSVLPGLQEAPTAPAANGRNLRIKTNGCYGSQIALSLAIISVAMTCDTGLLPGCWLSLVGLAGALTSVFEDCGMFDPCGGSCPQVGAPDCTSYSIC
jgi:hypothetical protein